MAPMRLCGCSPSLGPLRAKLQIARLLATIQLLEPCHGFVFAVTSSTYCKRRPRDTNLVLLIRDLYDNTVIQIRNNPGSHPGPNFQIDHFQPTVVLETQKSLPFKSYFLLIGHTRLHFHFLSSVYEREEDFPSQRQAVPQSQTSTTVERNTKEMNIF